MWLFPSAHQHKMLLICTRRSQKPLSATGVGFYHSTGLLLSPEDSGIKSAVRRRRSLFKSFGGQHQPVVAADPERSSARKGRKSENPALQKQTQRRDDRRVSSELRKLSLEDSDKWELLARQKSTQGSKADSDEIVFGIAPCILALTQGRRRARKLFVKEGLDTYRASVLQVCEEAHRRGIRVHRVSKRDLDNMSGGRLHQGVCLVASPLEYLTEKSAPRRKENPVPLWLILEGIQDPMNLGAILRSAYFLGVDRVCSSLYSSCPLSPVVSKASSGTMEVIGVHGCEDLEAMLQVKAAQGWHVVGTVGAEAPDCRVPVTPCSDFQMTGPTLLLMGGEGEGLSQKLLSLCQTLLTIQAGRELAPGIESLNVSVATGILLYTLLSSRRSIG